MEERVPLARWLREQLTAMLRAPQVQRRRKQVHATLRTLEFPLARTRDALMRMLVVLVVDVPDHVALFVRSHLRQTSMRVPYQPDAGTLDMRHYRVTMVDRGFGPRPRNERVAEESQAAW